jgi:hypothetical protein
MDVLMHKITLFGFGVPPLLLVIIAVVLVAGFYGGPRSRNSS